MKMLLFDQRDSEWNITCSFRLIHMLLGSAKQIY